ncbi:MAG: DUF1802 family protein [Planctomycetota bacterium]
MPETPLVQDGRLAEPLGVALKEWALVCDWLAAGRLGLLVRKGGVHEDEGPGRFRAEFDRFALFPNVEHQKPDWVKPAWLDGRSADDIDAHAERAAESGVVELAVAAEVAAVWKVPSRGALEALGDVLPWEAPYLDMRFHYKPDRPVWLMLLRAWRLRKAKAIQRTHEYDGCRSWVELAEADALPAGLELAPAMPEPALAQLRARVDAAMGV